MTADKKRLDWLQENEWVFYNREAAQLNPDGTGFSFARHTVRQAIDAAMKSDREQRNSTK